MKAESPGQLLAELRWSSGMSAAGFCRLTGIKRSTLARLEVGSEPVTRRHLDQLLAAGWSADVDPWFPRLAHAVLEGSGDAQALTPAEASHYGLLHRPPNAAECGVLVRQQEQMLKIAARVENTMKSIQRPSLRPQRRAPRR